VKIAGGTGTCSKYLSDLAAAKLLAVFFELVVRAAGAI
jgi:hypothetical protein